jgi:metal-responsive CopG/Arc/MetJ family transcriptional regulator
VVRVSTTSVVRFSITLPAVYVKQLDQLAAADFTSRNHQIMAAIRAHLDANKRRGNK